jgi:hypothetical protein
VELVVELVDATESPLKESHDRHWWIKFGIFTSSMCEEFEIRRRSRRGYDSNRSHIPEASGVTMRRVLIRLYWMGVTGNVLALVILLRGFFIPMQTQEKALGPTDRSFSDLLVTVFPKSRTGEEDKKGQLSHPRHCPSVSARSCTRLVPHVGFDASVSQSDFPRFLSVAIFSRTALSIRHTR